LVLSVLMLTILAWINCGFLILTNVMQPQMHKVKKGVYCEIVVIYCKTSLSNPRGKDSSLYSLFTDG